MYQNGLAQLVVQVFNNDLNINIKKMKIKKNNQIITLTEREIKSILKFINESKVDFSSCFQTFPSWLRSDSTTVGLTATETSRDKNNLYTKLRDGVIFSITNCEGLKNKKLNAGILSKITNSGIKEKAVEKTVNMCRRHLEEVVKTFESGDSDVSLKIKHIKPEYVPESGESIEEWVKKYDFTKDIENIKSISECLYDTDF